MFEFITDYFKSTEKKEDEEVLNKTPSHYNDDHLNILIGATTVLVITGYLFYKKSK